jgi:hypothetical protein
MADNNYRLIVGFERMVPCGNYELGDEPEPAAAEQPSNEQMLFELLEMQREEARKRKWTLIIGGLGALFAAARLGVVALPFIQERRRQRSKG